MIYVYVKRQTWIWTMWRSFPLNCRLPCFITSTQKYGSFTSVLSIRIATWMWRLPFAVNVIWVYREPVTAGGHVTSLSRHVWGLRRAFSMWGDRFSRMLFTWKLLAYKSCFIPRNDTKILWSKSLSINRGTNSGEMLNLINPIGS